MNCTIKIFGEQAILLDWPAQIDETTHQEICALDACLNEYFKDSLIETVVTYHSIALFLKPSVEVHDFYKKLNTTLPQLTVNPSQKANRVIELPVCYAAQYGLDLAYLAELHQVNVETIIDWHTAPTYRVYFIGFLPGFPYLGGLDERLHTARRATPRPRLSKGAVGIGGKQTGIYPQDSPGGWQIIGHCPVDLFDVKQANPCLLEAGDLVRFVSIDEAALAAIQLSKSWCACEWMYG